ncbi:hypothetical protein LPC_0634 [Legionella pneumophila str. Corby]|nr:hypothetical protein LPC_0634 [Legionella pneumophila str. Corby]
MAKLLILYPVNLGILVFTRNILSLGYMKIIFGAGFLFEHN